MIASISRARLDALHPGERDVTAIAPCARGGRAHANASTRTCEQVHSYAYKSPNSSVGERLALHAFWDYLVRTFCPHWVAPNAITVCGFAFCCASYASVWMTSPELTFASARWRYAAHAACMFAYQTLDGCDGKQARRTKSGSPLGEVIDHGCDALAMCVYPLIVCDIFAVGWGDASAKAAVVCTMLSGRGLFVVDTVASAYTGVLPVSKLFDSQEIQFLSQIFFVVAAIFGNSMLSIVVRLPFVGAVTVGTILACISYFFGVLARIVTFFGTFLGRKDKEPAHWPKHRSPLKILLACTLVEAFHGACLFYAPNFAYAHATSSILYGESEARIMSIRVSDPDFPVVNYLALFIMYLTTRVPLGDAFSSGILLGAALFILIHRVSNLAAQITGCLGLHPNIFLLRPKTA